MARRDVARRPGRDRHCTISSELIQTHREAAVPRARQIYLHDDRGRPGEALTDPQEDIGKDDPAPVRRPHQQERNRRCCEPAGNKNRFASPPIAKPAGKIVGSGFGHAEHGDERENCSEFLEPKLLLRQCRQYAALHAYHGTDERIDDH